MKYRILLGVVPLGLTACLVLGTARPAEAAACAAGVYRAGCVGPNGAAVVHKPPPPRPNTVTCVNGVYRAGCAGPNGAAVIRK